MLLKKFKVEPISKRMQKTFIIEKITVAIFGLLLFIVALEVGLRIGGFVYLSLLERRNMISIKQKGTYRILCLGESTTAFGDRDSYPRQLEEILNQRDIGIKFSVINRGIPGISTTTIISRLEDNLNIYAPDMVTTMMGANDIWYSIAYKDIPAKKTTLFLKSFKTYKLVKLLRLQIMNKAREVAIYKPGGGGDITVRSNDSTQPNNFKEQEKILKKALEINPRNLEAYIELGWYYNNQGEYDKAEAVLKKALEINPENDWAYIVLGWYYNNQGEYDKAEAVLKKAIEINPENDWAYGALAYRYKELKKNKLVKGYFRKANRLRLEIYNPITRYNYQKLKEIVTQRGIKLVCVQYPVRSIEPLKKLFKNQEGIIFVDNERVFKEALKQASYDEYFTDRLGGDWGHSTRKGNRLIAENIANAILKECFNKYPYLTCIKSQSE